MENIKDLSDERIVSRIQTGNTELFSVIIDRYKNKLFRYVNNILKNKDKAEDIIQEVFIKTYINLKGFNTAKKFSSWIYRIAHNESLNLIRKYNKELPMPENIDFKSADDIEEEYNQKEIVEKINKCLQNIPLIYSEPLILFFIEEKSYEEISDILQMPMGTVATRISRAKIIMKKICQQN